MYYRLKEETIDDIADAIREKTNTAGEIQPKNFASAIRSLEIGENTNSAAESANAAAASAVSAQSSALAASESAGSAANNATIASNSSASALESEQKASISENNAKNSALDSEAWAIGTRNGTAVGSEDETYHNNAKYWADLLNVAEFEDSDVQAIWDDIFTS